MSHKAVTWALKQDVAPVSTRMVLTVLAYHANPDTDECFPDNELLQQETGLSRRAVKLALKQLRDEGRIIDTGERRGKTGQVVIYRVNMAKGAQSIPLKGANDGIKGATTAPLDGAKGANYDTKGCKLRHPSIEEPSGNHHNYSALSAREVTEMVSEIAGACPVKSPAWMAAQTAVTVWLRRGADPELDIYPTVRRLMARFASGHDPPSPNYFTKAVDEARARRIQDMTAPEPKADDRRNRTVSGQSELPPYLAALTGNARSTE